MAITVVGVGAVDSATPWAPTVAGPVLTGDLVVLLVEQIGNETTPTATGYAHVLNSPVNTDTSTKLSVMWLRSPAGGETSVTVTGPVDHAVTRTITLRGVIATGNPWDVSPVPNSITTATTTATWLAVTTVTAGCYILFCISTGRDINSTANLGALTGGTGLTNITERMDNWVLTGGGGGIGLVTADQAAAGTTGAPTATMGTAGNVDPMSLLTLPLKPAAAAAVTNPPILVMAPRR